MKKNKFRTRLLSLVLLLGLAPTLMATTDFAIAEGNWSIAYKAANGTLDFHYRNAPVLSGVYARAKVAAKMAESSVYPSATLAHEVVADAFGTGTKYTIRYSGAEDLPDLVQVFYFYANRDYFLTEVTIDSPRNTNSNYIAPIVSNTRSSFLEQSSDNRVLSVPFDNDGWIRYSAFALERDSVSFEVTSIFNGNTRRGLVIGSVEHDTWKTGIRYSTRDNQYIDRLECFAGIAHKLTRDIDAGKDEATSKEHGAISGTRLKSSKLFVGLFDDWRLGLEEYGRANALVAPPRSWTRGTPFGWNSWGTMKEFVNADGVNDVAAYIKAELQPRNFENDGTVYIGLDSYWNENMSNIEVRNFVRNCNKNGQEAGIYWTPFCDWSWNGEKYMEGTNSQYKYKDAYLYADKKIRNIAGRSLDPTHPGTKMRIKQQIEQFKTWGIKYIKLDFMNSGSQEADSYYEPGITTGMQAFNHGMQYLVDECGDDIFLALAIAPTFPAQYAHSRRISCDVWGEMSENWGSTGYLLNSLSFGWWLDRVYPFNDADHIVLYDETRKYAESGNRARITSAVITGLYMLSDNYSQTGTYVGTQTARDRALKYATNPDINDIARIGRSFYPVEGYKAAGADKAENFFMMDTQWYTYFVAFNYYTGTLEGEVELSRLGVDRADYESVKELWSGATVAFNNDQLPYSVPGKDVKVYRLAKVGASGISPVCSVDDSDIKHLIIYSSDGKPVSSQSAGGDNAFADIDSLPTGWYIAVGVKEDGTITHRKFMK